MTTLPRGRLLALLLPIACVGLFARVYYTPDEPREASMVVAMASQADRALPTLAGRPFAEKPPLLYWLGGGAVAALGAAPAVARVPNLAYFLLAALAIGTLAARAAGPAAGFAAGFAAATMLQLYQALVWLATDAPLVAGVALALCGAYVGLVSHERRARLGGYLAMHAGLAIAFFAKGLAGWMVPALALLTVIALERRWLELVRVEFWAGAPLLLLAIGAWVWAVAATAGGAALKVLFWYNLVGRAVALDVPAEVAYAAGHANSPAKYLLELPLYLLPWTVLAVAALRRARRGLRLAGETGTAWRLALGAIGPPTVLLSLAATARGVYYAPSALGFALLLGLYVGCAGAAGDRFDRLAWRLTGATIALLAVVLGLLAVVLAWAPAARTPAGLATGCLALAAAAAAVYLALTPRLAAAAALPRFALATALLLSIALLPSYLRLNGWLSLEVTAARIEAAAGNAPLILLDPDETTVALAELYLPAARLQAMIARGQPDAPGRVRQALAGGARLLWLVPDRARWTVPDWLAYLGYRPGQAAVPAPIPPAELGALRLECLIVRPGGRTYGVLAAAGAAPATGAACR